MGRKDIFTSVVRTKGSNKYKVIPVKSTEEIDVDLWKEFSKVLSRLYISTPIKIGDSICSNILNTGVDIICTRDVDKD
ncbi:DUF1667 domain-containing protein [Clostridium intestinale]|jgi:CxxC motif-containing protein|uniref:DUF1667 domain-containing protein n=1 Tax=Clostridium intestinale DSM 6191 TaxID=1121320 RepID=A0A1M6A8G2_9CLOT|nr:DUF1667 domain-containing protein [Clostridium intestinale]WRY50684.1 DUF1667 domain-containing protein [Clostridium intestinale]SHI32762.1 Protein of unknown function [Clostridium intestinale DSM 6191]